MIRAKLHADICWFLRMSYREAGGKLECCDIPFFLLFVDINWAIMLSWVEELFAIFPLLWKTLPLGITQTEHSICLRTPRSALV